MGGVLVLSSRGCSCRYNIATHCCMICKAAALMISHYYAAVFVYFGIKEP